MSNDVSRGRRAVRLESVISVQYFLVRHFPARELEFVQQTDYFVCVILLWNVVGRNAFPAENAKFAIAGIQVKEGKSVILAIEPLGVEGEELVDGRDGCFVDGSTGIDWEDSGSSRRKSINEIFAR